MSDDLTSAKNAYLSYFPDADDNLKREIIGVLVTEIHTAAQAGRFHAFNRGRDDARNNAKFKFVQEYVKSFNHQAGDIEYHENAGTASLDIRSNRPQAPAASPVSPTASAAPRRRRQRQDPIADAIGGLGQAVTSSGSSSQWQQNVSQTSGQLTNSVADAVVERVAAPLTNAIRRSVSSSRSAQATPPQSTPAVLTSGNVTPGATFQPFQPTGEVPDLNNPPRWQDSPQAAGRTASQSRSVPTPSGNPSTATLAQRAAANAEHARRIVADISGGGGGQIPPGPPGGNDPPGPPDEPDDNDGILRQLLEFFQRMFGVRPDIDRSVLDTLANNLTSILGGTPAQAGADGQQPSSVATLMDTFADYFNVPRETEEATREAQENLRRSIDRLTEATTGAANGGTPSQPQTRWQRFRGMFRRSGRTRRGGIATATRIASYMRPVLRGIANIVPTRWRLAAGQAGANIMGGLAGRLGVPATTAARFGMGLGPAAIGIGVLAYGLPILGAGIKMTINGLNKLSDQALKTTFALASYGGLLAHANAQLEVNREMRKFDMANRMGGFGAERLGQLNRLENAMQPWEVMGNNAGNLWGAAVDASLATVLEILNGILATGMELHAAVLKLVPGDQGEAAILRAAELLRNPAANMPQQWEGREALFGQNAVDMIDLGNRLAGPRRPNNGGN